MNDPEVMAEVSVMLDLLTPKEREAVVLYYGLLNSGSHSLAEVAAVQGVTFQAVHKRLNRALLKMRRA